MDFLEQSSHFKSADDCYELADGVKIPCLGFGTWKVFDEDGGAAVIKEAISAGYRHFDAAAFYRSEKSVGQAVKESGIPRDQFFITSKIWKDDLTPELARKSLQRTLDDLKTDYVDLLLIHWPRSSRRDMNWQEKLTELWGEFQQFKQQGLVREIGTANFLPHHFACLKGERPAVNQIEFHIGYEQPEALQYCREHGILVEGWAALGRAELLTHFQIKAIAMAHGITPAQLCLKFCLQKGVLPLVKSADAQRMRSNRDLFSFTLTANEMHVLSSLGQIAWSGEHPDTAIPFDR